MKEPQAAGRIAPTSDDGDEMMMKESRKTHFFDMHA